MLIVEPSDAGDVQEILSIFEEALHNKTCKEWCSDQYLRHFVMVSCLRCAADILDEVTQPSSPLLSFCEKRVLSMLRMAKDGVFWSDFFFTALVFGLTMAVAHTFASCVLVGVIQ